MKEFFKVKSLSEVFKLILEFDRVGVEKIELTKALDRVIGEDISSDIDLPDFSRSTMDGYAVCASSSFGASEGNPAYLNIVGSVAMGEPAEFQIKAGEAARIATGAMLPEGADSVVMVEHTDAIDESTIEVYHSVAPGQNVIDKGEDYKKGQVIIRKGQKLRPQEIGLLAAYGMSEIKVFRKPVIGIISTGDEVVSIDKQPGIAQIRDINSYALSALFHSFGADVIQFGLVSDNYDELLKKCLDGIPRVDMLLISGGSSVGTRDFTIEVLSALPDSEILVHGISISPGKPTILAKTGGKAVWGLPGHVASAMIVARTVVMPFFNQIAGLQALGEQNSYIEASITRNISSAQGRTDFVRVRLYRDGDELMAEPILGKSGLINTLVRADGLVEIKAHTEGLNKGSKIRVIPI